MKKNYFIALLALVCNFAFAQLEQVTYRGAFAPTGNMWTDTWTNYDPGNSNYADLTEVVTVRGNITANTTWAATKTYKLEGLVYVTNNAVLTIEAGCVIKGITTSTGTALIITKGAKINAIGTATAPIVFTSNNVKIGVTGTQRQPGDWGGIVILGKAGFNVNGGVNNIEGITANGNTEYGGGSNPINTDNSGTLKYVRIEYAGFVFSPNNEINGLTMGAVGNGTTLDYIQVSYCNDDAFEWFGGSVNAKHLVSFRNLDDDFDTDNGYKGTVQFGLIVRDPNIADNPSISTSEAFESDNNAGGTTSGTGLDTTSAIFSNITAIGPKFRATLPLNDSGSTLGNYATSGYERALRIRRASKLSVINSIFMDFKKNYLFVDGSASASALTDGTLRFKNNIMAGSSDGVSDFAGGINLNAAPGGTVITGLKINQTGSDVSPNAWFTGNGNSVVSTSSSILTTAYNATSSNYSGLDYRPTTAGPADEGADFTGFVSEVPAGTTPVTANLTICKSTTPIALTATLAGTGTDLKFYTRTGTTTANYVYTQVTNGLITPSLAGVKTYYVTQMNGTTESAKAAASMTVTVKATPSELLTAISGSDPAGLTTTAAITAVSKYVGTTSPFIYTTSGITSPNTYLWTVPNGVNITAGQGTASITVNYANVAAGAGTTASPVGLIGVQSKNADGCVNTAKTITVTKKQITAPTTLALYNKNIGYATPTTAITNFSTYMGKSTALKLTAGTVADATGYQWELPAGVNVAIPQDSVTVSTSRNTYTAEPFLSPNNPSTTVATKYWVVTKNAYTYKVDGVPTTTTISTAKQNIVGSGSCKFTLTATAGPNGDGKVGSVLNVGTVFTYNGDTYVLSTATGASDTSLTCAIVFPLSGSNYPTATTSSSNTATIGTLTSGSLTLDYKRVEVTPARTYTFSVTANASNVCAVGDQLTFGGDTYIVATAVTSSSTTIVCKPSALPQPAGTYPSTNPSTNVTGSLTRVSNGTTIAFTKIVKANYDVTTSQDYLPYGTVITSNLPSISVKFDGVTNQSTTKLYFGVKAVNGVGASVTSNATNADVVANTNVPGLFYPAYTETVTAPSATTFTNLTSVFTPASSTVSSKAKLLSLVATIPAAPTTFKMYLASDTSLTNVLPADVSVYISTNTSFKLVAASSVLATSYQWELPEGVNATTGTQVGSSRIFTTEVPNITINFAGVQPGITSLNLGVKAVNTIGGSLTTNTGVTPTTTYKLLKLTATVPAAVSVFNGTITGLVCNDEKSYTFTASPKALRYTITAPTGSVVTTSDALSNTSNSVTTTATSFTVKYPATFAIIASGSNATSVPNKSLVIRAENGVGNNTLNLTKTLATAAFTGTVGSFTSSNASLTGNLKLDLLKFKRCQIKNLEVPAFTGASSYEWTVPTGATIVASTYDSSNVQLTGQGTRKVYISFTNVASSVTTAVVTVKAINSCGVSSTVKSTTLGSLDCSTDTYKNEENPIALVSNTAMYPNPATDIVNFDIEATTNGVVDMTIYSLDGKVVMETKGLNVENGTNSFTENVSSLNKGIYLVRITNSSSNEVITKKLIKN